MYVQDQDVQLIESYRKFLIENGPTPDFPSDERDRRKAFCVILRYVASYYLRWSPLDLYNHLTFELAETFKLNTLISKLGLRKAESTGYSYLVLEAYPQEKFPREQQVVIKMYERIVVPLTDGRKMYNIPCNLKEAYDTECKSLCTERFL